MSDDLKIVGAKVTGGGILTAAYALTMEQWIGILTICYLVMQILILTPKFCTEVGSRSSQLWSFVKGKLLDYLSAPK